MGRPSLGTGELMTPEQQARKERADAFIPVWARLAAIHCSRVHEATPFQDMRRATDLILATQADVGFAIRTRQNKYVAQYGDQMTIRYSIPSGNPTEWHKLFEPDGPHWYCYGFEAASGAIDLDPWHIINVPLLGEFIRGGGPFKPFPNRDDGSWGAAIKLSHLPPGAVHAGTGWMQPDLFAGLFAGLFSPKGRVSG